MSDIRVIRIPKMKIVFSTNKSCRTDGDERMLEFVNWAREKNIYCKLGMRQGFMFYSKEKNGYELIMSIPDSSTEAGDYEIKEFQGGLFAVSTAYMHEIMDKYNQIIHWVKASEQFGIDQYEGKFKQEPMGEIITPEDIGQKFNVEQQDIYIPIRVKD